MLWEQTQPSLHFSSPIYRWSWSLEKSRGPGTRPVAHVHAHVNTPPTYKIQRRNEKVDPPPPGSPSPLIQSLAGWADVRTDYKMQLCIRLGCLEFKSLKLAGKLSNLLTTFLWALYQRDAEIQHCTTGGSEWGERLYPAKFILIDKQVTLVMFSLKHSENLTPFS